MKSYVATLPVPFQIMHMIFKASIWYVCVLLATGNITFSARTQQIKATMLDKFIKIVKFAAFVRIKSTISMRYFPTVDKMFISNIFWFDLISFPLHGMLMHFNAKQMSANE